MNTAPALYMIEKHRKNNSRVMIHADVDVDGVGSAFIVKRYLEVIGFKTIMCTINSEKEHGIKASHAMYINTNKCADLFIVVDSSSNELESIKACECDVLVIDHHTVLHSEFNGKTNDGVHDFVIVNNTVENTLYERDYKWLTAIVPEMEKLIVPYEIDIEMSCGIVIHELFTIYSIILKDETTLKNLMLYQWAGITLFTDSVTLDNPRNQWYIENTVMINKTEPSIYAIVKQLNEYKSKLSSTFINYTFAPTINKAIRAGASTEALNIVLNYPNRILELNKYKDMQTEALNKVCNESEASFGSFIMKDITSYGISRNYCGVIAAHLSGKYNKNVVVYIMNGNRAEGSFRGRTQADYRKYFEDFSPDIYAQGHPPAFGFKATIEQLKEIGKGLESVEERTDTREYFSVGNMPEKERGVNHLETIDELRKDGLLFRIAIGNAKVSTNEKVYIKTSIVNVKLNSITGKLYYYDVLGLECKAFSEIRSSFVRIYAEFGNEVEYFVENCKACI